MQLRCLSRYRAGDVEYNPGFILDLADVEAERLMRDSPGSFERVVDEPVSPVASAPDRRARGGHVR